MISSVRRGKMLDNYSEPQFVTMSQDGKLSIQAKNVQEAKIALKQLKAMKKGIALAKKEIVTKQQIIRAEYTDKNRRQAPMMRGGKGLGGIIRTVQRAERESAKINLANNLAPLEKEKFRLEALLSTIEQGILKIETYIIENS